MAEKKVETKLDAGANQKSQEVVPFTELTARVAGQFQIEPVELWRALKMEFFPGGAASDAQMFIALQIIDRYKLNPFMHEMFAAISQKSHRLLIGVQYDGYIAIAHRHPKYKGFQYEYEKDKDGRISAVVCKVYRDDWEHPGEYRAEMVEWKIDAETWKQRPTHHLCVKAFNNAIRLTLGLTGIYDPDDIERIQAAESGRAIEITATNVEPAAETRATQPIGQVTPETRMARPPSEAVTPERKPVSAEHPTQENNSATDTNHDGALAANAGSGAVASSEPASEGPSVSPELAAGVRTRLDHFIAQKVTAARLSLVLGQIGVAKVEDLNEEQAGALLQRLEKRRK